MDIYFVRHGETGGNVAKRHQVEHSQLTPYGKSQVRELAPKVAALKPTHLITSSHVRAVQTASLLGEYCDILPETDLRFTELHRPKYLYGQHHRSFASIWYYIRWYLGWVGDDYADEEGESYAALRARITAAQAYLETFPPDSRIVVTTHAVFLILFVAHLNNKAPLTPWRALAYFYHVLTIPNASILHLTFEPDREGAKWQTEPE